ncbi:TetR/AcrR family transcriptional regulator [Bacillus chungangensis]|uniref:AcrR family transcriptional regulator n=1 Tax=Bacillus chungangensis TaxID=587633 RepID=A0ABT9WNT5_9BACI|nr:TetR/AcrR family transcriptional regulator [Bacillus chungangensis]MDQ0174899.1 AcrR family transcriptional regulator [Bacillus chungangensis]
MKAEIRRQAMKFFSRNGFEGASLAQIAEEVGIKKQSIYSHYKGKDDLFLKVLDEALEEEYRFSKQWLQKRNVPVKDLLSQFLHIYMERFDLEEGFRFGLRMSFFPPEHLHEVIMKKIYELQDQMEPLVLSIFQRALEERVVHAVDARTGALAYLAVLDAVCVELVYSGKERAKSKADAAWEIFWRGLTSR